MTIYKASVTAKALDTLYFSIYLRTLEHNSSCNPCERKMADTNYKIKYTNTYTISVNAESKTLYTVSIKLNSRTTLQICIRHKN